MSIEGIAVDQALENNEIEEQIRAEIAKLDPTVGFSEPQIAAIIDIVKTVLDAR